MQTMKIPGFTADRSLQAAYGRYRSIRLSTHSNAIVPAIPACRNCDYILDNCEKHNWRPTALCRACLFGDCYEDPPMPNPFPDPFDFLP